MSNSDADFARLLRGIAGDTRTDEQLDARVFLPSTRVMPTLVTPGVLDDDARRAYCGGQCHALAAALVEATGWPLLWVGRISCLESRADDVCYRYDEAVCHCQIEHIGVQEPGGRLLDILGPSTLESHENISTTVAKLSSTALVQILADPNWPAAQLPLARTFVPAVLALL